MSTNTNAATPNGSMRAIAVIIPVRNPNTAPVSEPLISATQTTAMSAKSGLAPSSRRCGATDVCRATATASTTASRATSPHVGQARSSCRLTRRTMVIA